MVLPAPVGPTSAVVLPALRREVEAEDALVAAPEAEGHVLVAHLAHHIRQRQGAGLLAHALGGVEQVEEAAQGGRVLEHAHGEAGQQVELADHDRRETDEGHDLAHGDPALPHQHGADGVDGDHGDGGGGAREHREQAPPGQHRILRGEQVGHDRAHGLHLGAEAGIALHHRDVAQHVADAAVDVVVVLLDGGLAGAGSLRHQDVGGDVDDRQRRQDQRHGRVHVDGGRDQHQDADQRHELLAQERQPVPEQRVGAGQDGAHDRARALLGVIADGQDDGVLEGLAERGQPVAMGQPVGHHRHHHPGEDADKAHQRPQADDGEGALAQRQGVHHARQQHLLGNRHGAERDAAGHDPEGSGALRQEHRQRALVDLPERQRRVHLSPLPVDPLSDL